MPSPLTIARVEKRSIVVNGHKTSVSLEEPFWAALQRIARREGKTMTALVTQFDFNRQGNLSSALRQLVLHDAQAAAEPQ